MSNGTKLTDFFNGRRREIFLNSWEHLKTSAGESRIKLDLSIPLLNRPLLAVPDVVSKAYAVMGDDSSAVTRANLSIYLEGMTVEFFATEESKSPDVSATGVTLQKMHLVAQGKGDKRTLDLNLVAYVPANVNVRDWAWYLLHGTGYLEAVYSQSEMEFEEESGPVDGDEKDEEESHAESREAANDILDFDESDPEPVLQ